MRLYARAGRVVVPLRHPRRGTIRIEEAGHLAVYEAAADAAGLNPPKDENGKREEGELLGWHDLRHTAISRLIAAGLDVVTVQRQAGHSKPSVTLDIYSHEFERAKRSDDVRAKIAASTAIKIGGAS